jgi:hypothetical protein
LLLEVFQCYKKHIHPFVNFLVFDNIEMMSPNFCIFL